MNVYLINAGLREYVAEYFDFGICVGFPRYETELTFEFISAPTRGKAKKMFCDKHDVEWIEPLRSVCLGESQYLEGIIDGANPLGIFWDDPRVIECLKWHGE